MTDLNTQEAVFLAISVGMLFAGFLIAWVVVRRGK